MKRVFWKFIPLLFLMMYSTSSGQVWTAATPLPTARDGMAAVVYDGVGYFIGGNKEYNNISIPTDSVQALNLETMSWENPPPPMNFARIGATAFVRDMTIYVLGGRNTSEGYLTYIEALPEGQNFWTLAGSWSTPREGARAIVLDDTLYVIGGEDSTSTYTRVDRFIFNSNNTLTEISQASFDLPTSTSYFGLSHINDKVFVFGGFNSAPLDYSYMLEYQTWSSLNSLSPARGGMGAASLVYDSTEGTLISGGITPSSEVSDVFLLNANGDPEMVSFPNLPFNRAYHSMLVYMIAPDTARIVVAGGSFEYPEGRELVDQVAFLDFCTNTNTGVYVDPSLPSVTQLQAYPNPANGDVRFEILNTISGSVQLSIYNVLGQRVRDWSLDLKTGPATVMWDGTDGRAVVPSGIYFLVAEQVDGQRHVMKLYRLP